MSASTVDRGLILVELDLDLDFLRMGGSLCNPKARARAALGIIILFMRLGIINLAQGPDQWAIVRPPDQAGTLGCRRPCRSV
jgi:hypothetical protein